MISVSKAEQFITKHLPKPIITTVTLEKSLGYTLATNIKSERDHPPFNRITHDGIAISFASINNQKFKIESHAAAGHPQAKLADQNNCIEVATGAPLPKNTDTIIPYESIKISNNTAQIKNADYKLGNAVHKQASDAKKGQILLQSGTKIGITEISILAANGVAEVNVYKKPTIGILATGDELAAVGDKILPHQIRRSNDIMLKSSLTLNGFNEVEVSWLPDDAKKIGKHLQNWLNQKDIIITIGGVSKGNFDHVPDVLNDIQVKKIFHNVSQRPGKPLWFGTHKKTLVFGLPGNPVSSLTCLIRYVIPALKAISGSSIKSPVMSLIKPVQSNDSLTLFIPVARKSGKLIPLKTQNSGDFTSLQVATGLLN